MCTSPRTGAQKRLASPIPQLCSRRISGWRRTLLKLGIVKLSIVKLVGTTVRAHPPQRSCAASEDIAIHESRVHLEVLRLRAAVRPEG